MRSHALNCRLARAYATQGRSVCIDFLFSKFYAQQSGPYARSVYVAQQAYRVNQVAMRAHGFETYFAEFQPCASSLPFVHACSLAGDRDSRLSGAHLDMRMLMLRPTGTYD